MDITPAAVRALRTTFYRSFREGYEETDVFYPRISTPIPSSSKQNDYGWMAQMPSMREWLGPRVIENLKTHNHSIENKTWELSFGVPRDDIEDDNLGVYSEMSAMHGEAARKHVDELMTTLMQEGHLRLCFDGQNFFDTDHPVSKWDDDLGTYSNYSASGMALNQTNFLTVRAAMMSYKGDGNRSLKVRPNLLVVPPALEGDAISILKKENTNGSNTTYQMADYIVVPELAGQDTTWYLLDITRRIKPFVHQTRRALAFQAKNKIDDDVVLIENEVRFYADKRDNAGYTLPFLAYKAVA